MIQEQELVEVTQDRAALILERLKERFAAVCAAVPPLDPESCYWLEDDATESYCRVHAIEARAREFGLGPPLDDRKWYHRTELEDAFFAGIGANHGGGGESDHTEACSVCGRTLVYSLTDYGLRDEITYWLENPIAVLRDEDVYALDRMEAHVWAGCGRDILLGVAAAVNQAWRLVPAIRTLSDKGEKGS